jgi:hypothetical protein
MKIAGYLFTTKKQAEKAVKDLNTFHKFPVENGSTEFNLDLFSKVKEGYFSYPSDEWILPVLGEPKEYEVTFNN